MVVGGEYGNDREPGGKGQRGRRSQLQGCGTAKAAITINAKTPRDVIGLFEFYRTVVARS